ncbi:MAG TPA: hypothetical protein VFM85_02470 [Actinomycetota bacterium]|nr:hypothetical protein [Actinomycetota bacterium]
MRGFRWLTVATMVGALLAMPVGAGADGGSYIVLDRTHYLPGGTAVGIAYVSVPERKQVLFERGPFYAFLVRKGDTILENNPIPESVIRVGTFSIEHEKGKSFELRVSFTVPDLPGAFYSIAFCDDPCTISGFREPLTGLISIVQTQREGQLLTEQSRLDSRIFGLRDQLRKAERAGEELQAQLDASEVERERLSKELGRLEDERTASIASSETRPLIDKWIAAGLLGLLSLAGALAIWRRRPAKIVVPDTIE